MGCNWKNCVGCPECSAELLGKEIEPSKMCSTHCYAGERANQPWNKHKCNSELCVGCPECVGEPHDASTNHHPHKDRLSKKLRGTTKKHSALRKIAVDNDKSHAASSGAVVGDVAKSTARGMEEVVQGASKAASTMFSKFLGLFGHANQITSQGNQEITTSAPKA